ncbi:MAG TPA: heavy metal-binding domain-containing protein, partial [Vicinamibacterales bacterium]|nr:heavy metal-binding domain-containing protein [Vicinamibacterales bacterium]
MTRTTRLTALVLASTLLAAGSTFLAGCRAPDDHGAAGQTAAAQYHCPMHPTVVSDRAGTCPICGMKLVPIKAAGSTPPAEFKAASASGKFLCPMHATVVADKPGTCPICGMKLEPVPAALTSGELKTSSGASPAYFCPMHPTVVSDSKGTCPVCEMDLEPIPAALKTGWSAGAAGP